MNRRSRLLGSWAMLLVLLLSLATVAIVTSGCATTSSDTDNTSERPWTTPRGWENGLPGGMYGQPH